MFQTFVFQCGTENDEFCKKAERKERQTSIMLIAIVFLFISCNTLAFVCNIMENLDYVREIYQTFVLFNNLLVSFNHSPIQNNFTGCRQRFLQHLCVHAVL